MVQFPLITLPIKYDWKYVLLIKNVKAGFLNLQSTEVLFYKTDGYMINGANPDQTAV